MGFSGCGWDSLVSFRPLSAAQSESSHQLVAAQENKRSQSEQRKNEEEEDKQAVPERRILICGQHRESVWSEDAAAAQVFSRYGTVPRGSAVHAAAVTRALTEWRRPAVLAVAVLVTVTHLDGGDTGRLGSIRGSRGPSHLTDRYRLTPCPWHFPATSQS